MTYFSGNRNTQDMYVANNDFSGTRRVTNDQEVVQYLNNSTIRIWFNELTRGFENHWHSAMEIILPIQNYFDVRVGEQSYHLLPNEILVIPPGEVHELIAPDSGQRFIYLFDISLISKLRGFSGIQSMLAQPLYINKKDYPQIYDELLQILSSMQTEYFAKKEYSELTIYALLLNFFTKLGYNRISTSNLFPNVRLYKQKEYIQKFNKLIEYIDNHYMEDLSLENIAENTGFSKYHFSRLFKQYTGFTFCDYVCHRRIKVAEELLAKPDLSITEVALQAGFPSISTFNRLFKQYKGCTPSEYRTKNQYISRRGFPPT